MGAGPDAVIAIGELSRQTGCPIETIRYYERIELLPAPARQGRYRSYNRDDVGRLQFICRSRELGFSLNDVRELLRLAGRQAACGEVKRLATDHLQTVRSKLSDLRNMERALAEAVAGCESGDDQTCPLIEALAAPA